MASENIKIIGNIAWGRLYEPDTAFGATKWKLFLFPENDNEWNKIKNAGIQKKIKENTSPENNVPTGKYIEFTRDAFKVIKGSMVNFTGPVVLNENDEVIVDYVWAESGKRAYSYSSEDKALIERRGVPVLIGNGSRVEVTVSVYDTQKGKGQRLEQVKILDLIEYEMPERELPPVVNDVRKPLAPIDQPEVKKDTKTPW